MTSAGATAVAQTIAVSFAGYFFHLSRRVSGGLIVPAVLHGMFDFSLVSAPSLAIETYAGGLVAILVYPMVAVILLVRRRHIELSAEPLVRRPRNKPRPAPKRPAWLLPPPATTIATVRRVAAARRVAGSQGDRAAGSQGRSDTAVARQ